jgi:colanic acid/amylovoran biosynthesis glycosyltransferase
MKRTSAKNLSVLVAGISWPPESFLVRLIRGLADAGLNVTVASENPLEPVFGSSPGLHWLQAPTWSGSILKRLLALGSMTLQARMSTSSDLATFRSHIRENRSWLETQRQLYRMLPFVGKRWDVIYFPWNTGAMNYFPLFELGCPVVISCRGAQVNVAPHNPQRSSILRGLRLTFERAAAVHCVSEAIRDEAIKYGLNPEKACVIHPAVSPEFFKPGQPRVDHLNEFRVVTTGSLIWRKGHEYALSAIRRLLELGVPAHFDIVGDGPELQRVLFTIHDLNLEKNVTLLGRQNDAGVLAALQFADLFLFSSLSEGVSNSVLEGMACGLPVVTSDCGGIREALRNGIEGFVVPLQDPEAMAKAVYQLYKDPELRKTMGSAARQRVVSDFSLDQQIKRFQSLFHAAISGKIKPDSVEHHIPDSSLYRERTIP